MNMNIPKGREHFTMIKQKSTHLTKLNAQKTTSD